MNIKLLYFIVLISWNLERLVEGKCDTVGTTYNENSQISPIKIGGYKYDSYTGTEFSNFGANPDNSKNISKYPFQKMNPQIKVDGHPGLYILSDQKEIQNLMNTTLNDAEIEINVKNVFLMINDVETCNVVYILYNEDETVLYAKFEKIPQDLYFNIGKGLHNDMVYEKLARVNYLKNTFVYGISGTIPRSIGCISTPSKDGGPRYLEMNQYKFSSLGGEMIWLRGPCELSDAEKVNRKIELRHLTKPNIKIPLNLQHETNTSKFGTRLTPIIWYPGLYKTFLVIMKKTYMITLEVYKPTEYGIELIQKEKINTATEFILKTYMNIKKPNITKSMKIMFRILYFNDSNEYPRPYETIEKIQSQAPICYGYSNKCYVRTEYIIKKQLFYPGDRIMGYFEAYADGKTYKSPIINLLWYSLWEESEFKETFMNGTYCQNYLSRKPVLNDLSCPVSLDRVKTTASIFEPVQALFQNLECYKGYFDKVTASGITCCYNSSSNILVTGASNFIDNNEINNRVMGSYRWKYLPTEQPNLHYLFDRLPMLSCCSNFNKYSKDKANEKIYLCNQYWNKFHNISTVNNPLDYTGDLFGDPHVIGFSSSDIQYSYIYHGFYSLLQVNNTLNIIGLFYAGSGNYKTVMQYLAIELDKDYTIEIVPVNNKAGTLTWTIIAAKSEINTLPIYEKGFMISESADKSILSIHTTNSDILSVKIELTKFALFNLPYTFMNFKVFIQIADRESKSNIQLEGLFGTVDVKTGTITLQPKPGSRISSFTANDDIIKTWKVDEADLKSLTYFNENDIKTLNNAITDEPLKYNPNPLCKGNKFCDVDLAAYPTMKIYESTLATFTKRSNYNDLEKKSKLEPKMCTYPNFENWILQLTDMSIGSVSTVIGCLDPSKKLIQSQDVYITCSKPQQTNGVPYWKVSISDWSKVCRTPILTTRAPFIVTTPPLFDKKTFFIVFGVIGIVLIISAITAFYIYMRHTRKRTESPYEMSVSN